jgi:hypothetical protein
MGFAVLGRQGQVGHPGDSLRHIDEVKREARWVRVSLGIFPSHLVTLGRSFDLAGLQVLVCAVDSDGLVLVGVLGLRAGAGNRLVRAWLLCVSATIAVILVLLAFLSGLLHSLLPCLLQDTCLGSQCLPRVPGGPVLWNREAVSFI